MNRRLVVRIRSPVFFERTGGSAPSSRQTDPSQPVFFSLEYVTIGSRRLLLAAESSLVGWNDFSVTGGAIRDSRQL